LTKVHLKSDDTAACPLVPGSCCGNATWSSFRWRALVAASVPFAPPDNLRHSEVRDASDASTATSGAVKMDHLRSVSTDQILTTVCLADKKHDGCTNATRSGVWSAWR
jgi:hypothetical protein